MNVKFLDLKKNNEKFTMDFHKVLDQILESGQFVNGRFVNEFEENFSKNINVKYTAACNSGTSAIYIALIAAGIKPGDEIIVPNMTFIATIEAIVQAEAVPVLVDVDPNNWNLSIEKSQKAISKKTKAIIFVHLHGNPSGILEIKKLALMNNLILIEDAAQAHLAKANEYFAGTIGDVAAFSFYPGKNLGAIGEGGCITTNSSQIYERAKLIINWGSKIKYKHEIRGSNYRMDEIQAAFLNIKLTKLKLWIQRRNDIAQTYNLNLSPYFERLPSVSSNHIHSFHIYSILVNNRNVIQKALMNRGIESGIHYPNAISNLIPWQKYTKVNGIQENSNTLAEKFLSLPISDSITDEEVNYVVKTLIEILEEQDLQKQKK